MAPDLLASAGEAHTPRHSASKGNPADRPKAGDRNRLAGGQEDTAVRIFPLMVSLILGGMTFAGIISVSAQGFSEESRGEAAIVVVLLILWAISFGRVFKNPTARSKHRK